METNKKKTKAKPRHIVNGRGFKESYEALNYLKSLGLELQRMETLMNGKVFVYHAKPSLP